MLDWFLQKLVFYTGYLKLKRVERDIGYKLVFKKIPYAWINGWVACEMTHTWKKFGLDIDRGTNYFTEGRVENGVSTRFNRHARQYQSWLGGYVVKFAKQKAWNLQSHCNLAVADQDQWLRWYEDAHPFCKMQAKDFTRVGTITQGTYTGVLYEGNCLTHSDVGTKAISPRLRLVAFMQATLFNISNPKLHLRGRALLPLATKHPYELVRLKGFIAIFDITSEVKVVLYANGAVIGGEGDTFDVLREDLLAGLKSCEIQPM